MLILYSILRFAPHAFPSRTCRARARRKGMREETVLIGNVKSSPVQMKRAVQLFYQQAYGIVRFEDDNLKNTFSMHGDKL